MDDLLLYNTVISQLHENKAAPLHPDLYFHLCKSKEFIASHGSTYYEFLNKWLTERYD
jgi:hypothetical protein